MGLFGDISTAITAPIEQNADRKQAQAIANAQQQMAQANIDYQKEFAQNGIQWRVEDAAKAGLSPLAALGAAEPGFSPVNIIPGEIPNETAGITKSLKAVGQSVDDALARGQSKHDRIMQEQEELNAKKRNNLLDEQILTSRWSRLNMTPPPNPAIPSRAAVRLQNVDGSYDYYPSDAVARAHPDIYSRLGWYLDNRLVPSLSEIGTNLKNTSWRDEFRDSFNQLTGGR